VANIPVPVRDQSSRGPTKDACRLKLLQHDLPVIQIDLQLITFDNIHRPAKLDGKHDPSQFVYLPYYSGGFHMAGHSFFVFFLLSVDLNYTPNLYLCQTFFRKCVLIFL
jgi:hypothetical protein